jgi:hypothetical protein
MRPLLRLSTEEIPGVRWCGGVAGNLRPHRGQARYRAACGDSTPIVRCQDSACFSALARHGIELSAGIDRRRRFVVHDGTDRPLGGFLSFRTSAPSSPCASWLLGRILGSPKPIFGLVFDLFRSRALCFGGCIKCSDHSSTKIVSPVALSISS